MDNNVTALKALYVALGGSLTTVADVSTIADMINAIATVVPSGSGSSLPEVTGANNGQVLTVVEGEWAAAAVPTELPAVTSEDNGDVLKVVEGVWAKTSS